MKKLFIIIFVFIFIFISANNYYKAKFLNSKYIDDITGLEIPVFLSIPI